MRSKLLLTLTLPVFSFLCARAQSVYTFRYNFNTAVDAVTYHAFLVRNDDGTGLLRVRFTTGKGGEDILVEAFTDEQNPLDKSGEPDTSLLMIKAIQPSFIQSETKTNFNAPVFLFRYNPNTEFFEPSGVVPETSTGYEMHAGASFTWTFLEGAALERNVVARFFSEDEEFYTNLFRQTTRGLSAAEKKIRMHLLIVADTLDKKIGISAVLDIKKVTETFSSVCSYLGIRLLTNIVYGKTYGKTGVQQALAKLRPSPADIVVFYYTGHGFRIPERPGKFPNLKLKNFKVPRPVVFKTNNDSLAWVKKEREANILHSLNIEDIFNNIRKKGARFNLVISDCCNDDIFSVNVEGTKPSKTKGSGIQWDEDNIRSLFLNKNPMSVLATAAQGGQKATSKNDYGGFFTDFFKKSLETHCSKLKTNVTWDIVLIQAKTQTTSKAKTSYCATPRIPSNICKQEPVADIRIGR